MIKYFSLYRNPGFDRAWRLCQLKNEMHFAKDSYHEKNNKGKTIEIWNFDDIAILDYNFDTVEEYIASNYSAKELEEFLLEISMEELEEIKNNLELKLEKVNTEIEYRTDDED